MSTNINRHRSHVADLQGASTNRAKLHGRQANGEIALAWYRGEAAGQNRAVEWLRRHGHKEAAKALKEQFG